jgi:hypothetical protein
VPGFRDSKGREWIYPEITEGTLMEIERVLGYDLHKVLDRDEAETTRAFSGRGMAELIWFMLREECEKAKVDQIDLAKSLNHKAKEDASYALLEALQTFRLGPDAGTAITAAIRAGFEKTLAAGVAEVKKQYGVLPV